MNDQQRLVRDLHRTLYDQLPDRLSPEFRAMTRREFQEAMLWVHALLCWDYGAPATLSTMLLLDTLPGPLREPVASIVSGARKPKRMNTAPRGEDRAILAQALWVNARFYDNEQAVITSRADDARMRPQDADIENNRLRRETRQRILAATGADGLHSRTCETLSSEAGKFYANLGVTAVN